ncbi:MAG TPA: DUF1549 domain-containing protein, partial [Humisphaera sp.]
VIKNFEAWVKMGAPAPADFQKPKDAGKTAAGSAIDPKNHWAFKPPVAPPVPAVKDAAWAKSDLDKLVLAKLEAKGLKPTERADKRTLIRRATYDLIGLPPTPEEVDAFLADESPDAFEKLVDRLLASPHYGEKWARHWLDVARYSDTKGYVFQEERRYPYAYTYRDWVIKALNDDKPYDKFVVEQLAGDQVATDADKRPMAALGFLTLGRRFLNNQHDIIDDRIDVVTRGLLGLTVACARCHDHKFDPVAAKDYYALHGVFASSVEPKDLPLLGNEKGSPEFEAELAKRQAAVEEFLATKSSGILSQVRTAKGLADYLAAAAAPPTEARGGEAAGELSRYMVQRWRQYLTQAAQRKDPVFQAWRMYAAVKPEEFAEKSKVVTARIAKGDAAAPVHKLVAAVFTTGEPPKTLREVADRYAALLAKFDKADKLGDADEESLRLVLRGPESPLTVPDGERQRLFKRDLTDALRNLQNKVTQFQATSPDAPPRAMVMLDSPTPGDSNVLLRGNPGMPGPKAPRRFLPVLATKNEPIALTNGSGRLDLAKAIADKDNPLTARVFVNRVWGWTFGKPLVSTP